MIRRASNAQLIDLAQQLLLTNPNQFRKVIAILGDTVLKTIKAEKETDLVYAAAQNENPAALRYLLNLGFDVNAKNDSYWTPLHLASFNGKGRAVCMLLCFGADPKRLSKINRNPPRAIAQRPDIEAIFDAFDQMTLEKFTEKYFPNAVQGVEEKNDVVTDMQDVTNRFPISDLPVDILCEVYDRLSIISANTAQKLVCKGWRDIFKGRFAAKFPYLETEWSVWENGSVA
jgi:hypothetical protein